MDWMKLLAEQSFAVVVAVAMAYWIAQLTKHHREDIKTLVTSFREEQKEERKATEARIEKMMQDHIMERTESRQQWQHSLNNISENVSSLANEVREMAAQRVRSGA